MKGENEIDYECDIYVPMAPIRVYPIQLFIERVIKGRPIIEVESEGSDEGD